MSCCDCRHWLADEEEEVIGACRRYPPTILDGGNERVEESLDPWDATNLLHRSVSPVTGMHWTCGEFLEYVKAN